MRNGLFTNRVRLLLLITLLLSAIGLMYIQLNQDHYTGSYKDGKYHGHGIIEFSNGDKFEGNFVEGHADGYGKFTYSNGEILEGIWEDQHFIGPGQYTFSDGEVWEVGDGQSNIKTFIDI